MIDAPRLRQGRLIASDPDHTFGGEHRESCGGTAGQALRVHHPDSQLWWLDDDLDLCRQMLPRLRSTGWQLRTFARPEPMLAALRAGLRPDLLVMSQGQPLVQVHRQYEGSTPAWNGVLSWVWDETLRLAR